MRSFFGLMFLVLISGPTIGETPEGFVTELGWMAGCWAPDDRDAGSVEQWMAPAGGAMLGMSRVVRDGKMVGFEYLRIVTRDSTLILIASPSGQDTTEFELSALGKMKVVFENPEHDFPQRIIYRLIDSEHLLGRVEGIALGGEAHIDFPMTRASCTAV